MKAMLSPLVALGMVGLGFCPAIAAPRAAPLILDVEASGPVGGRAPWSRPWEYDSGSDNDRRPELPYYQQGRGQQTGGPARNLLPDDGLQIFPR